MVKLLLVGVALVVGVVSADTDAGWVVFKATYGKVYDDNTDAIRRQIYEDNLKKIHAHNVLYAKGFETFYLGENQFADLTNEEFRKSSNGFKMAAVPTQAIDTNQDALKSLPLPAEVDWRTKGYVTPVKDQGSCQSCWSFSVTGSLEAAHFKKTGKLVNLSEKNLLDCAGKTYGNQGCNGGNMTNGFRYVIANKGIDDERSYPYVEWEGPCVFDRKGVAATMKSFVNVLPRGSELALQNATATIGPISVAIDGSHFSFQFYRGGIYNALLCNPGFVDRGMLVVGYGTDNKGKDYWILKNSQGTVWGESGYMRMARNVHNHCGVASRASYPVV